MPEFLHGSEVIEVNDGVRSITTVKMSVIGIAVQSAFAVSATKATLTLGSAAINDDLTFTAAAAGSAGNGINVSIALATEADQQIAVTVKDKAISITLGSDANKKPTGTVTEIVTAYDLVAEATALAAISTTTKEADADVPEPISKQFLSGGSDEPFPLNKPVLVLGNERYAEGLGVNSQAYKYVKQIMEQYGALVVVVRTATSADSAVQKSNIIEAIGKFKDAQSEVQYKPRILIAPGYSHDDGVGKALESAAEKLRGVTYLDMDVAATYTDTMKRRKSYGGRVEIMWPQDVVFDSDLNVNTPMPKSVSAAGLRARIDAQRGVHVSKSNKEIYNTVGTNQTVDWALSDKSCLANILNENRISTTIREGGFRHWGNRNCSIDPKWTFETTRRVADMINDSIELNHLWAVDEPGTTQYMQDVLGGVNAYLRQLKNEGIIPGGKCWLDKDLNTPELMAQGIYYFDFDFGVYYPAEHLIFRSRLNNGYLEEVIANV